MHDIRAIRENPAAFDAALARRGDAPISDRVLSLDETRRAGWLPADPGGAEPLWMLPAAGPWRLYEGGQRPPRALTE